MTNSIKIFTLLVCLWNATTSMGQIPGTILGELLIQLQPGVEPNELEAAAMKELGILPQLNIKECVSQHMRIWLCTFDESAISKKDLIQELSDMPLIQTVQANHILEERVIPDDPFFTQQWHHVDANDHDIDSDLAWDVTTGGTTAFGDDIVVCVVELGGAKWNTADIVDNHWINSNEIPGNSIDDDLNGYVDDVDGWNIGSSSDDISTGDHGTRVSSMIGAKGNNASGITGVNWDVKIMQVQIGGVSEANAIAGYEYAMIMRKLYNETNGEKGAFVVATNSSWGTNLGQPQDAPLWCAMYDSLGYYGVLSCGSTSNNNVDVDAVGDLPTACPSDFMVSVGRTNNQDVRASGGYGLTTIDLMAPGDNVYLANNSSYGITTGTSFSGPCVAGAIALLYSAPCNSFMQIVNADPEGAAALMKSYILDGVDATTQLQTETVSGGRLNVNNSLNLLLNDCDNSSCIAPFGISASQVLSTMDYTISWEVLSGISLYNLQYRAVGEMNWTTMNDLSGGTYLLQNLMSCTTYEVQIMAQCDTENSNWSSSYSWTTDGCCINPTSANTISVTGTTAEVQWNEVIAATAYTLIATPEFGDPILFDNVTENPFVLTGLSACSEYVISIQSVCNENSNIDFSFTLHTSGCDSCDDLQYCTVSSDASSEHIQLVVLGDINRTSENDGGYVLVTDMTTTLHAGSTYDITVAPGYSGGIYNENFKAWIDYNSDGNLDLVNELIFDAPNPVNAPTTGSFTVPLNATTGVVRFRVGMAYTSDANPQEPYACGNWTFGETEDYCVTLDGVVSVKELNDIAAVLFPNPVQRELHIQLPDAFTHELFTFNVYNSYGQLVMQQSNSSGNVLQVTNLSSGLYTVVMHSSKTVFTSSFIKE